MPAAAFAAPLHDDLRTLLDLAQEAEAHPYAGDLLADAALHLTMLDRETLAALGLDPDASAAALPASADPLMRQFVGHRSTLIEAVARLSADELTRPAPSAPSARPAGGTVADALSAAIARSGRIRADVLRALRPQMAAAA